MVSVTSDDAHTLRHPRHSVPNHRSEMVWMPASCNGGPARQLTGDHVQQGCPHPLFSFAWSHSDCATWRYRKCRSGLGPSRRHAEQPNVCQQLPVGRQRAGQRTSQLDPRCEDASSRAAGRCGTGQAYLRDKVACCGSRCDSTADGLNLCHQRPGCETLGAHACYELLGKRRQQGGSSRLRGSAAGQERPD